jgi:hypothetical protein
MKRMGRAKNWLKITSIARIVMGSVETSVSVVTVFVTQCFTNKFEKNTNKSVCGCIILI